MPLCLEGAHLGRPGLRDNDGKAFGKTPVHSLASLVPSLCEGIEGPGCQEGNPEALIELGAIESSMLGVYDAPENSATRLNPKLYLYSGKWQYRAGVVPVYSK